MTSTTRRALRVMLATAITMALASATATTASATTVNVWAGQKTPSTVPAKCSQAFPGPALRGGCTVRSWTAADYRGTYRGQGELVGGQRTCLLCQDLRSQFAITAYSWTARGWVYEPVTYTATALPKIVGAEAPVRIGRVERYTADWAWVWYGNQWRAVPTKNILVVRSYTW